MTKKKSSQSKSLGLGMGLDALIKSKTKPASKTPKTVEEKPEKKPAPKKSKPKTKNKAAKKEKARPNKPSKTQVSADDEMLGAVSKTVKNNPRITLWSAQSAAVLRYLKKTQPEFSISNEASKLIDEAVKEKYPEIWDLFNDL
ncbi:AAA family ATPase [Methanobacterium alcaliphilum]|uniref:AAA family ATPase n=1 Tax=Methanobacterium alcaliphilum TaxID=392018 RepID=UPI00200A648B|nr:AAA family ATPase [Methanobacterium alcaliphilum]MCK9151169.1 AAA family ATPase [Methanobacterium alcaliphilum]